MKIKNLLLCVLLCLFGMIAISSCGALLVKIGITEKYADIVPRVVVMIIYNIGIGLF